MAAAVGIVGAAQLLVRLGEANRPALGTIDGTVADAVPTATQTVAQALVLIGCAALAHSALGRWAPTADQTLLPLTTLVTGIGWVLVGHLERVDLMSDVSAAASWRHTGWVALGAVAFTVSLAARWGASTLVVASCVAVAGLCVWPIVGYGLSGAATHVVGPQPPDASLGALFVTFGDVAVLSFELAKIALVVALAGWLTRGAADGVAGNVGAFAKRVGGRRVRVAGLELFEVATGAAAVVVGTGAAVVLWFARDLVAALVVLGIGAAVMAAATERSPGPPAQESADDGARRRRSVLELNAVLASWTGALAGVIWANDAVRSELGAWFDALLSGPETEFTFALAEGGVVGAGLGLASPLVGHDPSAAMLNSFGEAFGLLGVGVLVALVAVVAVVALRTAARCDDRRTAAIAAGTFGALVVQPMLVLASNLGLLPATALGFGGIWFGPAPLVAGSVGWALLCRATSMSASDRASAGASDRASADTS